MTLLMTQLLVLALALDHNARSCFTISYTGNITAVTLKGSSLVSYINGKLTPLFKHGYTSFNFTPGKICPAKFRRV